VRSLDRPLQDELDFSSYVRLDLVIATLQIVWLERLHKPLGVPIFYGRIFANLINIGIISKLPFNIGDEIATGI